MKKVLLAPLAALGLLAFSAPASATPDYPATAVAIASEGCGTATITYDNPTDWTFWGDYRVGDEAGEGDDATGIVVAEGPLAGQEFGNVYHLTEIGPGGTEQVEVSVPEDAHGGSVDVTAWINRGPEQHSFAAHVTVTVDTDCEEPSTTAPPSSDPTQPPSTDPVDPSDPSDPPVSSTVTQPPGSGTSTATAPPAEELDCTDFANHADAQAALDGDTSDPHWLDGDKDGVACEDLIVGGGSGAGDIDNASSTGDLADTGASSALAYLGGGAVVLLVAGGGLYFLARRRATNS